VSEGSVVDVVYTLRAERQRMRSSIPGRDKGFLSVLRYPDRLLGPRIIDIP